MDDNTASAPPGGDRGRRLRRWIVPAAVCVLVPIGLGVLFMRGRTVWTDGLGARPPAEAPLREVVWTAPEPVESPIAAPSEEQQYEPAFSPDGTEFYFVRGKPGDGHAHIYASYRRNNAWTTPVLLDGVNGPTDDLSPRLTADGQFLLFSSDRPGGVGGFDLWATPRLAGGKWGKPYNLGAAVNSEFNESNPDPTPDGKRLVFSTDRKAAGKEQVQAWRATIRQTVSTDYDLWIARVDDSAAPTSQPTTTPATHPVARAILFKDARELPGGVNTPSVEGASCVSPVGDFLYFASNRPGGYGKFDIYRSRIIDGGETFGPPENLGPAVNSAGNEADPALLFGGFRLCFSSDRGNPRGVYALFRSDSREVFPIRQPWPLPHFGLSVWLLLISALLLIPLIMALRGTDMQRRLSILQKCLLLSLLIHAALTFIFSFVQVTQQVMKSLKHDANKEIAVNLNLPTDVQIGMAVRNQLSSDLPAGDAPPVTLAKAILPNENTGSQAAVVKTVAPPSAADRSRATPLTISTPAAPPPQTITPASVAATLQPQIPTPQQQPLDAIAPQLTAAKVADPKSDLAPVPDQPRAQVARSSAAAVPDIATMPTPAVAAPIPQPTAAPALTGSETAPLPPSRAGSAALPADAATATPGTALTDPATKLADLTPAAPAVALKPTADPTLAAAAARLVGPSPTAGPLATKESDQTNSNAVAVNDKARVSPTTAPTRIAAAAGDDALKPAPYRPADPAAALDGSAMSHPTPTAIATTIAVPTDAALPKIAASATPRPAVADPMLPMAAQDALPAAARLGGLPAPSVSSAPIDVTAASVSPAAAAAPTSVTPIGNAVPAAATGAPIVAPAPAVQPEIAFAPVPGPSNVGPAAVPDAFPRAPEVRKPRVEQLGGNKQSEEAVDRGLAYLARNQEPDGRWTFISPEDNGPGGRRPHNYHDNGSTGLALLALLARDNTPDKPGPYRNHVNKALNYLLAAQEDNGDLRGPAQLRGADSSRADMYDHAIATLALAEAAIMTGDKHYADAALRGARFIVAAQDPESGGWRYVPGQFGDTSVFGWQIMALHACEKLGFETPARTRALADDWINLATSGPRKMLASYQPRRAPTPAMTAEMLYTRMLLGQKLEDADVAEATGFLVQSRPDARQPNVYYWYYGSLCMLQVQNDLWRRWNAQTRDALIALQSKGGGRTDGSWDADPKYGDRGGRVYMTSLALLTLEVYYRYERITPQ